MPPVHFLNDWGVEERFQKDLVGSIVMEPSDIDFKFYGEKYRKVYRKRVEKGGGTYNV